MGLTKAWVAWSIVCARAAPWCLLKGPGEKQSSKHALGWRVCGDWRWVAQVRRQICFPLRRDPSCSNLTTVLRDVPSLVKTCLTSHAREIGEKAWPQSEWRSSERLGKPITSHQAHTHSILQEISAGLHWELTALTNQRALWSTGEAHFVHSDRPPPTCPFDFDDPTM